MTWLTQVPNLIASKANPLPQRTHGHLFNMMDDFFKVLDASDSIIPRSDWSDKIAPPINVFEEDESYIVETELPGVKKKNVDLEIIENVLTIRGKKESFDEKKKDKYYRMERSHGSFMRSVQLPIDVDSENISAKMEEGLLRIEIKKSNKPEKKKKSVNIH